MPSILTEPNLRRLLTSVERVALKPVSYAQLEKAAATCGFSDDTADLLALEVMNKHGATFTGKYAYETPQAQFLAAQGDGGGTQLAPGGPEGSGSTGSRLVDSTLERFKGKFSGEEWETEFMTSEECSAKHHTEDIAEANRFMEKYNGAIEMSGALPLRDDESFVAPNAKGEADDFIRDKRPEQEDVGRQSS